MNQEQKRALKALERAFARCLAASISIRGQGDTLIAWSDLIYKDVEPGGDMSEGVLVECTGVHHGGCFVDSGADDQLFGRLTDFGKSLEAGDDDD